MANHLVRRHAPPTPGTLGLDLPQSAPDFGEVGFIPQVLHRKES